MLMLKPLPIDRSAADANISVITFIAHVGFDTQELAHMLDSLVRVSRRVEWNHFVTEVLLGKVIHSAYMIGQSIQKVQSASPQNSTPELNAITHSPEIPPNATQAREQYRGEYYQAHSLIRRRATMSPEVSPPPHRR